MTYPTDDANDTRERDMGAEGGAWREYTYNNLSHSRAHYLMAIETLRGDLGYARTTDVAEMLDVSRGAASMALTQLKKRGWVTEDPNRFLLLTDEGRCISELVSNNFEILRSFFEQVLGLSKEDALADACKMEHLINIETGARLRKLTEVIVGTPDFSSKLKRALTKINPGKKEEQA